ncbi:MAG: hypothetical protein AMK72_08065 [Planctomycetes bacterium SM23_25]|nr:MAG: hypothetical protein AMK72_08065 [Planctomycetes bacterium SM23_25]
MAVCDVCKGRQGLKRLHRRLAIPEYRSMIGFWPWIHIKVCDDCVTGHDRDFRERLALLAPDVFENDEPIVRQVCLACGAAETDVAWHRHSKWLDAAGRPARRATFYLCGDHADLPYVGGIVVGTNLVSHSRMAEVLEELPVAGTDLLKRVERWDPQGDDGPAEATDFAAGRTADETLDGAMQFWEGTPDGLEARAAWLGPVRRDYRMRYRLDLVRDFDDGRRETLVVIRTGAEAFTTYRTVGKSPREARLP